jgi:chorismate lyase/3-hydroxybenzoate synthase
VNDPGTEISIRASISGSLALLSRTIPGALDMPAKVLRAEVAAAYRHLNQMLASIALRPIRFWNYLPGIGDAMGDGIDRYMVFNAGRYDALAARGANASMAFDRSTVTASAVGIGGASLFIQCLASESPGTPVENPRQAPSWRYSSRYGPKPPCFSRGTVVPLAGRRVLLIGGTASVVGEQSMHPDDVPAQFDETLANIGALIARAARDSCDPSAAVGRVVELRAYATNDDVAQFLWARLAGRCPNAHRIEVTRARVCRPDLMLEIEGLAELDDCGMTFIRPA